MKCLVTGGAGFIGSHLVDRLLNEGHQVVVVDNFSTGRPENLEHLKNQKNLNVLKLDITEFDRLLPVMKDNVDFVFHLAALADIIPSIVNPKSYYNSNVTGTFCVAETARLAGVKKLIYAASSSCYGIPDKYPTPETTAISAQYPYALTKCLGEEIVLNWGKIYKLPAASLRFFNVYGPRSRTSGTYGAVFGVFLAQKLNNKPFTVVGDGRQKRDFVYVTDVANALYMAAKSNCTNIAMNVGTGSAYTINELVRLLGGDIEHIPKRPGEPDCTLADVSLIKKTLKWEPKISFEEGVKSMLDNIDYWRNAPVWTPEKIEEATKDWFKYLSK